MGLDGRDHGWLVRVVCVVVVVDDLAMAIIVVTIRLANNDYLLRMGRWTCTETSMGITNYLEHLAYLGSTTAML